MSRAASRFAVFGVLMVALAACAQYSLVEAKRQDIGGVFSVDPQVAWSRTTVGKVELWTVDGPGLEAVRFYKGLRGGEALFEASKGAKLPEYAAGASPSEVMELVVDSLSRAGASYVEGHNLRPAKFGAVPGFRFELSYLTADGLEVDGMACGATIDDRLYLILYTGARMHYFAKYRDHVERLIQSIETAEGAAT